MRWLRGGSGWPRRRLLIGLLLLVTISSLALYLIARERQASPLRRLRTPDARLAAILPTVSPAPAAATSLALATPRPSAQQAAPLQPGAAALATPFAELTTAFTPLPSVRLPAAFQAEPWSVSTQSLLERATATVLRQLQAYPPLAPYQRRVERAAGRVRFLMPFEFLVSVAYDRRPGLRDEILALYEREPAAALRRVDALGLWPSQRGELLLDSQAQFDVDEDRILVNLGATEQDEAYSVLVHELWHAAPDIRFWQSTDGQRFLTSGFWSERWDPAVAVWIPVEEQHGLIFPPYLLDEAMAYRLEWQGTGRQPPAHEQVQRAAAFFEQVEGLIGAEQLLSLYLRSDDSGFFELVQSRRDQLGEFLK